MGIKALLSIEMRLFYPLDNDYNYAIIGGRMKEIKLTIMEKLTHENDSIQECLNIFSRCLEQDRVGDPLDTLAAIAKLLERKRKVAEKWLKLAYEVAPPEVRTAKILADLEKQYG
jgi:hypothetical protein